MVEDDGSGDEFEAEFERKATLARSRLRVNSARGERTDGDGTSGSTPQTWGINNDNGTDVRSSQTQYKRSASTPSTSWGSAHSASATYVPLRSRPGSARGGNGGVSGCSGEGGGGGDGSTGADVHGVRLAADDDHGYTQRFASQFTAAARLSSHSSHATSTSDSSAKVAAATGAAAAAAVEARRRVKEEQRARGGVGSGLYTAPMPSVTYRKGQQQQHSSPPPGVKTADGEDEGGSVRDDNAPPGSPFDKANESFGRVARGPGCDVRQLFEPVSVPASSPFEPDTRCERYVL